MPLYDNIVDAVAAIQDGASHTVALDCQGATLETNEFTYGEGWPGVWFKIDLSAYVGEVLIPAELLQTAGDVGFAPYIDCQKVIDASFDPSAPDFTKLGFASGFGNQFVGDGTTNPITTLTLTGGTGLSTGSNSQNGIFYLIFTDWNFVGYGAADFTYTVPVVPTPPVIYCIDAIDDPGSSGTLTVLGDAVRETQTTGGDGSPTSEGDATPVFYVRGANLPAPGTYTAEVTYRRKSTAPTQNETWTIFLKRNGLPLGPIGEAWYSAVAANTTTPLTSETIETGNAYGPLTIPIIAGDEIEVCAYIEEEGATLPIRGIEILSVCFTQVVAGGSAGAAIYPVEMSEPQTPLGGTSYDPTFDGTYYAPSSKDMLVMPNGDVYVFYVYVTGTTYAVRLAMWDGATWAVIEDDVWGHGNPGPAQQLAWNASIATDGTDVYLVWGESTTVGPNTQKNWVWRCMKYSVSGATLTELGSGQGYYTPVAKSTSPWARHTTPNSYWEGGRATVYLSPADVIWVSWVEERPDKFDDFSTFAGSAGDLDGGVDGFNSLDGSNPAERDGSGNAVGSGGESGSWFDSPNPNDNSERVVFEIDTAPAAGTDFVGVNYRVSNEGSSSYNCLRVICEDTDLKFQKVVAGVVTTIHTDPLGVTVAAGDRIAVMGSYSYPIVYFWDASAGTPSWSYRGVWTADTTYTATTGKQGICFGGTSGKMEVVRAMTDQGTGLRPCVSKWNGSSWDDADLPFYPGAGPYPFDRRNDDGYQYVGVVQNGSGEQQIQMTFCNADGPSEYPSLIYTTEHSTPMRTSPNDAQPHEIQWHYCEWDGADWVNWIMVGNYSIWGERMYETSNSAPYYFASNSFEQGFTFFHDGERPCFVANVITHTSSPDLVGFAKLKADGSGFEPGVGNPDDAIRINPLTLSSGGPWLDIFGCPAVFDSRGQIFQWGGRTVEQYQGHLLMRNAAGVDIGTGSDWMIGAYTNNRLLWYAFYNAQDRLGVDADDNIYVLTEHDLLAAPDSGSYVFKWTPGAAWYPLGSGNPFVPHIIRHR